ncbi:helix-turn-helix domain-containing protein [Actinocorallia libanotica]|uniref:HTH cro/C1-type domain-containing protein n=1 Tax=Actinocorallia libanotica TaxID=46162 RepID=A0ABN1QW20_9ACTN
MTTQHEVYTPGLPADAHGFTGRDAEEFDEARAEALIAMKVAQAVYDRRTARGWSQTELARRARTTQTVVSRIENSAGIPTISIMVRLLSALGADLDLIIRDHDEDATGSDDPPEPVAGSSIADDQGAACTVRARKAEQGGTAIERSFTRSVVKAVAAKNLGAMRAASPAAFLHITPSAVAAFTAALENAVAHIPSPPGDVFAPAALICFRSGSYARSTAVTRGSDLDPREEFDIVIAPSHDLDRDDAEEAVEVVVEAFHRVWTMANNDRLA